MSTKALVLDEPQNPQKADGQNAGSAFLVAEDSALCDDGHCVRCLSSGRTLVFWRSFARMVRQVQKPFERHNCRGNAGLFDPIPNAGIKVKWARKLEGLKVMLKLEDVDEGI